NREPVVARREPVTGRRVRPVVRARGRHRGPLAYAPYCAERSAAFDGRARAVLSSTPWRSSSTPTGTCSSRPTAGRATSNGPDASARSGSGAAPTDETYWTSTDGRPG